MTTKMHFIIGPEIGEKLEDREKMVWTVLSHWMGPNGLIVEKDEEDIIPYCWQVYWKQLPKNYQTVS
jgi:hypothetical protein